MNELLVAFTIEGATGGVGGGMAPGVGDRSFLHRDYDNMVAMINSGNDIQMESNQALHEQVCHHRMCRCS